MFNIFKTNIGFYHPLEYYLIGNLGNYFKHPIGISNTPISHICDFGKQGSFYLATFLILRSIYITKYTKKISLIVLIITFSLSLLNFNALIYLIPYFIIEIYIIRLI